jgi:hypothetical protein
MLTSNDQSRDADATDLERKRQMTRGCPRAMARIPQAVQVLVAPTCDAGGRIGGLGAAQEGAQQWSI